MRRVAYAAVPDWMSVKHLHRYTAEAVSWHNLRPLATTDRMALVAGGMEGQRLRYADLTARSEPVTVPAGDPF